MLILHRAEYLVAVSMTLLLSPMLCLSTETRPAESTSALLEKLASHDALHNRFTDSDARSLAATGPSIIPDLLDVVALNGKYQNTHTGACKTLHYLGPSATESIPPLIDRIRSVGNANWTIGPVYVDMLTCVGPASIAPLTELGAGKDRRLTDWALHGLVVLNAVAPLVGLLDNDDAYVRAMSARSLRSVAINSPNLVAVALPALTKAMADKDQGVRMEAAIAIGQMRGKAEPSVETLVSSLHDPDKAVAWQAAENLDAIGTQPALLAVEQYRLDQLDHEPIYPRFPLNYGATVFLTYALPKLALIVLLVFIAESIFVFLLRRRIRPRVSIMTLILLNVGILLAIPPATRHLARASIIRKYNSLLLQQ
jgi:hypothetical protein